MTKRREQGNSQNLETENKTENQEACPNCLMPKEEWSDREGFEKDGDLYCCEGCAQNIGCMCGDEEEKDENEDENEDVSGSSSEDTTALNRDADI